MLFDPDWITEHFSFRSYISLKVIHTFPLLIFEPPHSKEIMPRRLISLNPLSCVVHLRNHNAELFLLDCFVTQAKKIDIGSACHFGHFILFHQNSHP